VEDFRDEPWRRGGAAKIRLRLIAFRDRFCGKQQRAIAALSPS
jgi:hypothetical protein